MATTAVVAAVVAAVAARAVDARAIDSIAGAARRKREVMRRKGGRDLSPHPREESSDLVWQPLLNSMGL